MIQKAAEFAGRIDILFNNVGAGLRGSFDDQTNDDWQEAFALNFYAAHYGVRAVLPIMRKQASGHTGILCVMIDFRDQFLDTAEMFPGEWLVALSAESRRRGS